MEAAHIEHCQCWLLSSELSWKNRDLRTFGSSLRAMEVVAVRPSAASDAVTSREVKSKTGWPKSIKWKLPSRDQSFAGIDCWLGWDCKCNTCGNQYRLSSSHQ